LLRRKLSFSAAKDPTFLQLRATEAAG